MSRQGPGRPRLSAQTKRLRGTFRDKRERRRNGDADPNDEHTRDALRVLFMRLGSREQLRAMYPDEASMLADWRARRLDVWKEARGSLPGGAYYFDRLTHRGSERRSDRALCGVARRDSGRLAPRVRNAFALR